MSLVTYQINQVVSKTNEVEYSMTGNIVLPVGNTAERANEYVGSIRYNSEKGVFEVKDATSWMPIGNFILNDDLDTGVKIENDGTEDVINVYNAGSITAIFTNSGYYMNPTFTGTDITNSSVFVDSDTGYVGFNKIDPQSEVDVEGTVTATLFEGRIEGGTY